VDGIDPVTHFILVRGRKLANVRDMDSPVELTTSRIFMSDNSIRIAKSPAIEEAMQSNSAGARGISNDLVTVVG
jgi:hypothetical protein